jgi:hypothetical protein
MPIFMDVHRDLGDVTEDDIRAAHERDLEIQDDHGVRFLTFWLEQPDGHAFCLVEAPDKESAIGKSLGFIDRGPIALKGFDDPARLYQIGTIT